MSKFKKAPYRGAGHGNFEEEWGVHKHCSEWWYLTGYFYDGAGHMYSCQFTMLRVKLLFFRPYIIMLALTDFETQKHYYFQNITLSVRDITIDEHTVAFGKTAAAQKQANGMRLTVDHKDFRLDLTLGYGKGAIWHCDNGLLQMGVGGPKQTTVYYSYTNMPVFGTLELSGERKAVRGKAWFDKQGGPYGLIDRRCMWEWFSLRFFDEEEMMLFSFPQSNYCDGTYIRASGSHERLCDYTITPTDFVYPDGQTKYSAAWEISVPGLKDEAYTVTPLLKGQMNMGYCELLAGIYDRQGEQVGLCFAELLPGVYNKKFPFTLLKRRRRFRVMNEYDVIVVGAGPGGTTAASLLAHAGKIVLLIDKNPRPGGRMMTVKKDGFSYEMFPINCVQHGSLFEKLSKTLGKENGSSSYWATISGSAGCFTRIRTARSRAGGWDSNFPACLKCSALSA
ncbi:MAG TPA: lipocalin-like domain-containing protein [Clostridia bacterium]|nr:lipocalin-like domain-containing protein [Clostridia bacterium]